MRKIVKPNEAEFKRPSWNSIFQRDDYFYLLVATGFGAGFSKNNSIFATILRSWAIVLIVSYVLDNFISNWIIYPIPYFIVWAVGIIFFIVLFYWGTNVCESAAKYFEERGESFSPIVFGHMWAFWAAIFFASATWGDGVIDFWGQVIIFLLLSCAHIASFEPIDSFDEKKKRDRASSFGSYFMKLSLYPLLWSLFVWTFGFLFMLAYVGANSLYNSWRFF